MKKFGTDRLIATGLFLILEVAVGAHLFHQYQLKGVLAPAEAAYGEAVGWIILGWGAAAGLLVVFGVYLGLRMRRARLQTILTTMVALVLEIAVVTYIVYIFQVQKDQEADQSENKQLIAQHEEFRQRLIFLGVGLVVLYVLYLYLRQRRLSEHVTGEKVKTHVLLESLPQGLFVIDPQGMIVASNERGCAAVGIDPVLSLGQGLAGFLDPDGARAVAGESAGRFSAAANGRPDRKLRLQVSPLRGGHGKVVAVEEAALAVGETGVAPRTGPGPLSAALLDALEQSLDRAMAEGKGATPAGRRALAEARLSAHRLSHYGPGADSLPDRVERKDVDAGQILDPVLALMGVVAEWRGAKLEVQRDGPLAASVDPEWMRRSVEELLANAVAFVPEGGVLRVKISAEGGDLVVTVQDNGPGIPEDELPRVTEAGFVGSKAAAGSRGLGLALARRVAEAHGGSLRIESRTGVGTRVNLALPRAAGR